MSISPKSSTRKLTYRPRLELLEDRMAPATLTWQSAPPGNNLWSNPANWSGGVIPHNNDTLRFLNDTPTNVNHTANNNLTNLVVNSLQIGNNFDVGQTTIVGNQISLVNGISNTSISGSNFIGSDLALVGNGSHTISVPTQTAGLTIGGRISGVGPFIKTGPGKLLLSSNGNSYSGLTEIDDGTASITSGTGLGSSGLNDT